VGQFGPLPIFLSIDTIRVQVYVCAHSANSKDEAHKRFSSEGASGRRLSHIKEVECRTAGELGWAPRGAGTTSGQVNYA
jgi:hypothetical protein